MNMITAVQKVNINERISAGMAGCGWLFVTEISASMRVRIGQRGEDAH